MALVWSQVLIPSSEAWNVNKGASRSGGRSLTNREQIVEGPSGYTTASLTIPCNTPTKVREMCLSLALGRSQVWFLGPVEVTRAPWFVDPLTGGKISYGMGAKDAAIDPAFENNPDTASTLDFRTAGPVAMNATAMTIQRNRGGLLLPGMMFSIGNRLHIITALTTADPADPGSGLAVAGQIGVQFRPWLRADYAAGTPIEFGKPLATVRLGSDPEAVELQLSRMGTATLDFVEAF